MLKLMKYEQAHHELIENYLLSDSHLRFTSLPAEAVAAPAPLRTHILAMDAGQLVTFFSLDLGEDAFRLSQNKYAILVRSFSTDARYQGRGYAKRTLQLLPTFLKDNFPYVDKVVLAVNCKNAAAQGLYTGCGFTDTLRRCEGRTGSLIIMQKELVSIKQYIS